MALRGLFDAGKCALGLHQGTWLPPSPGTCTQVRRCERCGDVDERVEHTWGEWEAQASSCQQRRACARCHQSEDRIEHRWAGWEYPDAGSCTQRERCGGCGAWNDQTRTAHSWSAWGYSEHHRSPVRECRRCGARTSPFPAHFVDDGAEFPAAEAEVTPKDAPTGSVGSDDLASLTELYQELQADGTIAPERQPKLTSMLSNLTQGLAGSDEDRQEFAGQIQQMMPAMAAMLANPSRPDARPPPEPGSRAEMLTNVMGAMYAAVVAEISTMNLTGVSGEAAFSLLGQLREAREGLVEVAAAGDLTKLEVESLRPVALGIRRFGLRSHLTLAHPIWPGAKVSQDPNAVFYAGGEALRALVAAACADTRLDCLVPQSQREPASLRWEQLRRCAVGVFDLTGYSPGAPLEDAAAVASVAYELGMALALGRAAVVVAEESTGLPFDIDIEPLCLSGGGSDAASVAAAIDQAVYGVQRGRAGTSVVPSLAHLRELFEKTTTPGTVASLDVFDEGVANDPVRAERLSLVALAFLHADAPHLLLPTWPGAYPDDSSPRCFHVTAFGPRWAGATMAAVEQACPVGMTYVRGDRVLARDILRSIWDDIGGATHVVVDLTGLNANVTLELGMADVLGRNVLLISQDERPERYFRTVAKNRCHRYVLDAAEGPQHLGSILERFLTR